MTTQDQLVLKALSTDNKAMLLCRHNAWSVRQTEKWEPATLSPLASFEDEFRALEMFVEETTLWCYDRFNPNI